MMPCRDATTSILRIDASARRTGSCSRQLGDRLVAQLQRRSPQATVIRRDLAQGMPLLTEAELAARATPPYERTPAQQHVLQPSDELIAELKTASVLVLTTPIYNFSIPAALKAYIDQVCRPGLTFRYTEAGPIGLLNSRAYFIITSGGTPLDSDVDFATGYLRHIFEFMGIEDMVVIAGDRLLSAEAKLAAAQRQIDALASTLPQSGG